MPTQCIQTEMDFGSSGGRKLVGAFDGVEWTDTTGRRRVSNYWPASTAGTAIVAYFYNDPLIVYEIAVEQRLQQRGKGRLGRRDHDQGEHRKGKLPRIRPDIAKQAQVELQARCRMVGHGCA